MSDYDRFIDGAPEEAPPPRRKPGRPRKNAATPAPAPAAAQKRTRKARAPEKLALNGDPSPVHEDGTPVLAPGKLPDATEFQRPVTRTLLAEIFSMEPRRLTKQLALCPVVAYKRAAGKDVPLYDFKEAISYIVEPKIDIAQWIKTQSTSSLPPAINKAFWDAMRSKQMVEERSGDLWRTQEVLAVLGETALELKETMKLWMEALPGRSELTSEQHEYFVDEISSLQDMLYDRLVEKAKEKATRSTEKEIEAVSREVAGSYGSPD